MARKPPDSFISKMQSFDTQFRISHKLSCCRSPDFLLDIMNAQGSAQSMNWLGPIIQAEPDTLDALPISFLCELLLIVQQDIPSR